MEGRAKERTGKGGRRGKEREEGMEREGWWEHRGGRREEGGRERQGPGGRRGRDGGESEGGLTEGREGGVQEGGGRRGRGRGRTLDVEEEAEEPPGNLGRHSGAAAGGSEGPSAPVLCQRGAKGVPVSERKVGGSWGTTCGSVGCCRREERKKRRGREPLGVKEHDGRRGIAVGRRLS